MKITKVTAWWIQIPIEEARQHTSDFGTLRTFDSAILKIETDDGLIGQQVFAGEATRLAYGTEEAVEGRDAFLEKRKPDFTRFPWHF